MSVMTKKSSKAVLCVAYYVAAIFAVTYEVSMNGIHLLWVCLALSMAGAMMGWLGLRMLRSAGRSRQVAVFTLATIALSMVVPMMTVARVPEMALLFGCGGLIFLSLALPYGLLSIRNS